MTGGYSADTGLPFGKHHEVNATPDHVKPAATLESLEFRLHNPPASSAPSAFFDSHNELMQPTGSCMLACFALPGGLTVPFFFSEGTRQYQESRSLRGNVANPKIHTHRQAQMLVLTVALRCYSAW